METLNNEKLKKVLWRNVKIDAVIYLYASHEGKEYGCGPFQVIDPIKREIKRFDEARTFIHYPEEVYRLS